MTVSVPSLQVTAAFRQRIVVRIVKILKTESAILLSRSSLVSQK
jgi:hypothetical protein